MDNDRLIYIGNYRKEFNRLMNISIPLKGIYCSKGLSVHLNRQNHSDCLKYLEFLPDIVQHPDYIGINPNESEDSIELVKIYDDNVLIGIKLDSAGEYLYISTMYTLQEAKLKRRLYSGRLKKILIDENETM